MAGQLTSILLLIGISATVNAISNLTSTGCVDPSGFESCQGTISLSTQACLDNARENDSEIETLACGCTDYIGQYNCYATSCWNRVYECEYQEYIVEYLNYCSLAETPNIPYFPAPDDAPDSCSCNLGKVWEAVNSTTSEYSACENNVSTSSLSSFSTGDFTSTADDAAVCACCGQSAALSDLYSICPNTDPSLVGLSLINSLYTLTTGSFSSCTDYLAQYDCAKDFGFATPAGGKFLNLDELVNGTATLSNIAGTVTSPASGTVFTYTNPAVSAAYTITAASAGKDASTTASGSATSTGKGSKASSGSGSGSAASATSTTTKSGAQRIDLGWGVLGFGVAYSLAIALV